MNTLSEANRETFSNLRANLKESRLAKAAAMIAAESDGGRLLDIGCGDAEFCARFFQIGFEVHGLDLDRGQVGRARERGVLAGEHDLAAGPLPYEGAMFDVVFAGEVIEHVVDTTYFLREVWRVLRPGGALVLTTPNLASFENRVRLMLGYYPVWLEYKLEGGHGHVRGYTPRTIRSHLTQSGYAVEGFVGNWVPFLPQRVIDDVRAPWLAATGDLFPSLAMDMIVKARKTE
jgi:2-polyprenyl-3-methyl-5-hydroxy-6-metoxy-1,4-benzoquinol methylase